MCGVVLLLVVVWLFHRFLLLYYNICLSVPPLLSRRVETGRARYSLDFIDDFFKLCVCVYGCVLVKFIQCCVWVWFGLRVCFVFFFTCMGRGGKNKRIRVAVKCGGKSHVIDNNNISFQYAVIIVDSILWFCLLFLLFGRVFERSRVLSVCWLVKFVGNFGNEPADLLLA